jgi:AraC-like DNA-binding protein
MRRIERARQLLARHRFTNKELAGMLGFHDEFHFAKTFKKLAGKTPRQEFGRTWKELTPQCGH